MFILALFITIAVVVTRSSDDDPDEATMNDSPARVINRMEFLELMQTLDLPIEGNHIKCHRIVVRIKYEYFNSIKIIIR